MSKSKESFNKKQRETKRQKQIQDKKNKLEERKANKKKGGSLEDMMAYVDENGQLSDTPPDPGNKREIKQEDIQIGVPKQEEREEAAQRTGTVIFFNKAKGFGFISETDTEARIFFHVNEILQPLEESDKVQFQVERGIRGLNAIQVSKLG